MTDARCGGSCTRQPRSSRSRAVGVPVALTKDKPARACSKQTHFDTYSRQHTLGAPPRSPPPPTFSCTLELDFFPVPSTATASTLQGFVCSLSSTVTLAAASQRACLACPPRESINRGSALHPYAPAERQLMPLDCQLPLSTRSSQQTRSDRANISKQCITTRRAYHPDASITRPSPSTPF